MQAAAAVFVVVVIVVLFFVFPSKPASSLAWMIQDDDDDCSASTHCSLTSILILMSRQRMGDKWGEDGGGGWWWWWGSLRYLLRAPLAFVEDVPENKHYLGPEQPQGGLESPLHLPLSARFGDNKSGCYYLLLLFFVYKSLLQRSARRVMDREK